MFGHAIDAYIYIYSQYRERLDAGDVPAAKEINYHNIAKFIGLRRKTVRFTIKKMFMIKKNKKEKKNNHFLTFRTAHT